MIIVMAGKWAHFDTCSLLPNLQHVRPSDTVATNTCCLLQHSKTLRLIDVSCVNLMTNCTHQLAIHSVISVRRNLDFWHFSLQMLEKSAYLRCTVCLSVSPFIR